MAAESEEAAAAALAAIDIEYQELPGLFDVMEAVQPQGRQIWPDRSNIYHRLTVKRGDLEAGFAAAEIIIENTYQTQCMEQAFLEPEGRSPLWTVTARSSCTRGAKHRIATGAKSHALWRCPRPRFASSYRMWVGRSEARTRRTCKFMRRFWPG